MVARKRSKCLHHLIVSTLRFLHAKDVGIHSRDILKKILFNDGSDTVHIPVDEALSHNKRISDGLSVSLQGAKKRKSCLA
jgi:hypothetical protein